MNTKLSNRFPTLMVAFLAALLPAVMVAATGGADRGRVQHPPAAAALELNLPASDGELIWVRQDTPVINANGDPTFYEAPEGDRFEGSFWEYIVDETAIIYEERYVDHDYEWYHITLRSEFVRPPMVINPPLRYKLTAHASHSATKTEGAGGIGFQIWYDSDYALVDPHEVLAYYPWSPNFTGQAAKTWMVSAPEPRQAGDTFKLFAGWWNCPPCNVTWTYKAEPAYEVEQLGAEVVAPVVNYQGAEVVPGGIFYPNTCAIPDRKTTNCGDWIEMSDSAVAYFKCMSQIERILAVVERSQISELKKDLVMYIAGAKLMEQCRPPTRAGNDYELALVLEEGAFLLESVIANQSVSVHSAIATATAAAPGTLLAGYDPEKNVAIFRAHSVVLNIQSKTGQVLALQPGHQVKLTAAGFGPVTKLPQVLLPAVIR